MWLERRVDRMIETEKVNIPVIRTIAYICDMCHKRICVDDWIEFEESIHIKHECGYGSVFGDCNTLNLDICQHCFQKMISKPEEFNE